MIIVILLVALILRLISLGQSLWLDEAINVNVSGALSVKDLIFHYSLGDFHPPLFHIILKYWIIIFKNSEISVRLPSVIFGVSSVFVAYLIAKKLFEKKTALIAATLVATAPLHIYYSQEARMYMLAAFLASLSVYFFISLLKKESLLNWLGFIVSTSLMLYVDYLPYLIVPTYLIFLFTYRRKISKSMLKGFIPAFVLILGSIIPWLLIFPKQLSTGLSAAAASPAWSQVVGGSDFKSLLLTFVKFTIGRISIDNNLAYALVFAPISLFVLFLFFASLLRLSRLRLFVWFWFFIPTILGFIISFYIPIFSYFRFIFILPAFYLVWASAINTINWPPLNRILLFLALLINLSAATIYFINPKFQRENWRDAYRFIAKNATPKTIVLFESNYTAAPFDYYNQGKIRAEGALESFNAKEDYIDKKIDSINSYNKVYLFQYLSGITDPQGLVFKELTKKGYINTQTSDFQGVGFIYEFKK